MSELRCIVVTPERTVLDREAWFVALPLYDGELGVAPGRSPMIGRLGYGELRLESGGGPERYYIEGGFVEVLNNRVSLLTERAVAAGSLGEPEAREALAAARGKLARSPEQMAVRDRAVDQARAQLRIAQRNPK